jgi:hypothetical protein
MSAPAQTAFEESLEDIRCNRIFDAQNAHDLITKCLKWCIVLKLLGYWFGNKMIHSLYYCLPVQAHTPIYLGSFNRLQSRQWA